MSATLAAVNSQADPTTRVALRMAGGIQREALARRMVLTAEPEADVLVVELADGATLPLDTAEFEGALLVLSDDPLLAADGSLPGVLRRDAPAAQIAAAVTALAAGLTVRSANAAAERDGFAEQAGTPRLLTPREVEVLAAVGEGHSNKAIARRLGISAHTVKYHLEAVFAKLGVRSRAEAVTRGLRLGVHVL